MIPLDFKHLIIMFSSHHKELVNQKKIMTQRRWHANTENRFIAAWKANALVRVWGGQGHSTTLGWMSLIFVGRRRIRDMTSVDCFLEGCGGMSQNDFYTTYFAKPALKNKKNPPSIDEEMTLLVFHFFPL